MPPSTLPFCGRRRRKPCSRLMVLHSCRGRRRDRREFVYSYLAPRRGFLMLDLSPDEWIAIRLSLKIALVATAVALPFGIALAWLLARKNFWGKTLLDGLVHMPLVLPPVVTGYLLLISFGRRGPSGAFLADHFGIVFSFRWTGAALACGIMAFPLMVRAIRLSLDAIYIRFAPDGETSGADSISVY